MKTTLLFLSLLWAAGPGLADTVPTTAGAPAVVRKPILNVPLAPEKTVASVAMHELTLPVGTNVGVHLHPCPVVGYVIEGAIVLQVDGQPARHLRPGDAFHEPANACILHFDNEGAAPARFAACYLLGPDEHELIRMLKP